MRNRIDHKLLGFVLIIAATVLVLAFWFSVKPAHASTGDNLSPTARDWQRLNICANYSVRHDIKPESQEKEAIECAAKGKAVARIESANGFSYFAKQYLNGYGIMGWDKNGKRHIRRFKSTAEADRAWAASYFDHYRKQSLKSLAHNWTGESWMVKSYVRSLNIYIPLYRSLYKSMVSK